MFRVRRWFSVIEHKAFEAGRATEPPLRKVAAVAVIENPYAGQYVENLEEMIGASRALGVELAKIATDSLGEYKAQSYGKGGLSASMASKSTLTPCLRPCSRIPFATPSVAAKPGSRHSRNALHRVHRSTCRSRARTPMCARTTTA